VLIADDEPAARRGVRQLLAAYPEFGVAAECRDGEEVLAALDRVAPHVIFLDVQMPGMDGFEVIRRRSPERMPVVVFLTAYDQFAVRAFEAQAMDYLVKPVTEARFRATIDRLRRQLGNAAPAPPEQAIVVTSGRGATVLRLSEIEWIEAADNYARIWTAGRSYLLRESLRALEERVRPRGFVRAHRRALVRIGAVQRLAWSEEGEAVAVLGSGARIPISRRRRAEVMAAVKGRG
jgi:two-component system LytT family response regulator